MILFFNKYNIKHHKNDFTNAMINLKRNKHNLLDKENKKHNNDAYNKQED